MVYRPEDRPRRRHTESQPSKEQLAALKGRSPDVERRLDETRIVRARISSDIRSLLIRRNEAAAMALADRVPARAIAEVTGMKAIDVKRVAGSMMQVEFTGTPAGVHLERLAAISAKLTEAIDERERAERRLLSDAQDALQSGACDVFRVAAVTNMTAERVRELIRNP